MTPDGEQRHVGSRALSEYAERPRTRAQISCARTSSRRTAVTAPDRSIGVPGPSAHQYRTTDIRSTRLLDAPNRSRRWGQLRSVGPRPNPRQSGRPAIVSACRPTSWPWACRLRRRSPCCWCSATAGSPSRNHRDGDSVELMARSGQVPGGPRPLPSPRSAGRSACLHPLRRRGRMSGEMSWRRPMAVGGAILLPAGAAHAGESRITTPEGSEIQ
jgi:hypothetical protein